MSKHKYFNDNNCCKCKDHCYFTGKYRVAGQSVCNLRYSKTKEISVVSHKGSNCDYYFIIKRTSKIV